MALGNILKAIVRELGLAMDWREFLERFDAWPERIYPETIALLDAVPAGIGRALLSNTNAAHWDRSDIAAALSGRFDEIFLSFRTGLLKPDQSERSSASFATDQGIAESRLKRDRQIRATPLS